MNTLRCTYFLVTILVFSCSAETPQVRVGRSATTTSPEQSRTASDATPQSQTCRNYPVVLMAVTGLSGQQWQNQSTAAPLTHWQALASRSLFSQNLTAPEARGIAPALATLLTGNTSQRTGISDDHWLTADQHNTDYKKRRFGTPSLPRLLALSGRRAYGVSNWGSIERLFYGERQQANTMGARAKDFQFQDTATLNQALKQTRAKIQSYTQESQTDLLTLHLLLPEASAPAYQPDLKEIDKWLGQLEADLDGNYGPQSYYLVIVTLPEPQSAATAGGTYLIQGPQNCLPSSSRALTSDTAATDLTTLGATIHKLLGLPTSQLDGSPLKWSHATTTNQDSLPQNKENQPPSPANPDAAPAATPDDVASSDGGADTTATRASGPEDTPAPNPAAGRQTQNPSEPNPAPSEPKPEPKPAPNPAPSEPKPAPSPAPSEPKPTPGPQNPEVNYQPPPAHSYSRDYHDAAIAPRRHLILWGQDPRHEAYISFGVPDYDKNTIYRVYLSTSPHFGTNPEQNYEIKLQAHESGMIAACDDDDEHANIRAHVRNLKPNTTYYYIAIAGDQRSKELHFVTAPDDTATAFKLLSGGDSRTNTKQRRLMNQTMAGLLAADPQYLALIHGGDFVEDGAACERWLSWRDDHDLTMTPQGRVLPLMPTFGNHEAGGEDAYEALFMDHLANDGFYYDARIGRLNILILNSEISVEGNQKRWLKDRLAAISKQPNALIIPSYHKPAWPAHKDPGPTTAWISLWEQYLVDLVLESDGHTLKQTCAIRDEECATTGGIIYVGEGGLGVDQRKAAQKDAWYFKNGGYAKGQHHVQAIAVTAKEAFYQVYYDQAFHHRIQLPSRQRGTP